MRLLLFFRFHVLNCKFPPTSSICRYEVDIPENVSPGSTVAWIRATDRDSDLLGTAGIRFTRVSGPMSEFLRLDPRTGVVSVAGSGPDSPYPTPSPFDRERSDLHHLTVEARDEGGAGNRNSVELILRVTDVNDNPPRYSVFPTFEMIKVFFV